MIISVGYIVLALSMSTTSKMIMSDQKSYYNMTLWIRIMIQKILQPIMAPFSHRHYWVGKQYFTLKNVSDNQDERYDSSDSFSTFLHFDKKIGTLFVVNMGFSYKVGSPIYQKVAWTRHGIWVLNKLLSLISNSREFFAKNE